MTGLCCVRRVSQTDRGHYGETRSISIFVKKKILVTEMYIIVNDVCEYDLIYILKVIIVEYTEVHIKKIHYTLALPYCHDLKIEQK